MINCDYQNYATSLWANRIQAIPEAWQKAVGGTKCIKWNLNLRILNIFYMQTSSKCASSPSTWTMPRPFRSDRCENSPSVRIKWHCCSHFWFISSNGPRRHFSFLMMNCFFRSSQRLCNPLVTESNIFAVRQAPEWIHFRAKFKSLTGKIGFGWIIVMEVLKLQ
jgi:hypothetical protein